MNHIPEPWDSTDDGNIVSAHGLVIADFVPMSENARRIVACVNACAGIPIEVLEEPGYSIKAELDSLDRQIGDRLAAEAKYREIIAQIQSLDQKIRDIFAK